jgi:hypothetical protein
VPHTITVVIEAPDDKPNKPVIRSVTFHADNGQGVTAADLLTLQTIGLQLPGLSGADYVADALPAALAIVREPSPTKAAKVASARTAGKTAPVKATPAKTALAKAAKSSPAAAPVKKAEVPAKSAPAKKTATAKTEAPAKSADGKRVYRRAPEDSVLALDYRRFKGEVARIAEEHDVPVHTATNWIARLKRNGTIGD